MTRVEAYFLIKHEKRLHLKGLLVFSNLGCILTCFVNDSYSAKALQTAPVDRLSWQQRLHYNPLGATPTAKVLFLALTGWGCIFKCQTTLRKQLPAQINRFVRECDSFRNQRCNPRRILALQSCEKGELLQKDNSGNLCQSCRVHQLEFTITVMADNWTDSTIKMRQQQ